MDFVDYREKLGIGFCDEEKAELVITNLISYVKIRFSSIGLNKFINYVLDTGSPISQMELAIGDEMWDEDRGNAITNILLSHEDALEDFLAYFIPLINNCNEQERTEHQAFLKKMFEMAHIPFEIFKDNDGYFIFPKGAEELDNALVSQPLKWLKAYPYAHTAWIRAIREYADTADGNASDIADKFRKALETFFQEFFHGNKSLENFKAEYGKYLKDQGIPKEVSGNFETLLQSYTQFINNYAKHRDATSDKVLEYIMYQTGNIIRLLITLKQEEPTDAY